MRMLNFDQAQSIYSKLLKADFKEILQQDMEVVYENCQQYVFLSSCLYFKNLNWNA